jgi:hypothetical protein
MSPKTKTTITAALVLAALTTDALAQQRRAHAAELWMDHPASIILIVLVLAAMLALYFLPTFVARKKDHPHRRAIFWVNLLLGWSGAGWCVAALWALVG